MWSSDRNSGWCFNRYRINASRSSRNRKAAAQRENRWSSRMMIVIHLCLFGQFVSFVLWVGYLVLALVDGGRRKCLLGLGKIFLFGHLFDISPFWYIKQNAVALDCSDLGHWSFCCYCCVICIFISCVCVHFCCEVKFFSTVLSYAMLNFIRLCMAIQ